MTNAKIERLEGKIKVCSSCINVMNYVVNNNDMMLDDLLRSISDLILYNANKDYIKNDIYAILKAVVPKKIYNMCN